MSRFFIDRNSIDETAGVVTISGEDVNHIKNVLRMTAGEELVLCDGEGTDYNTVIDTISKDRIFARIVCSSRCNTEPDVYIVLFQGIPKSDKMDFIIQKCVELGVSRIVPVITERTVVRFDNARDMESKRTRWQRICLEAAKQCNRGRVPQVSLPLKFAEAVKLAGMSGVSILPYEKETAHGMKAFFDENRDAREVSVFIGPEGGFSDMEACMAMEAGIRPVTLGPRILRTETAGIAVLSQIMYELGDMG